ncbi:MAG: Uma2 family endonuclease [Planctomycetota bacterium]|nr:Uma2 family endonuclease [Planctomycetota bacterium]
MSNTLSSDQSASVQPVTLPITTEQYETLVNAGAFAGTNGQIELIHGRIVRMNPQGPEHSDPIDILNEWSIESVQRRYTVRVEKPIRIPEHLSSSEPDIAWATRRRYSQQHPGPQDIHLLIEVSQTSSSFDRTEKLQLYAKAKIAEYWQVDIPSRSITVHRQPQGELYRSVQTFDESETIHPLCLPDAELVIATLFPAT